MKKTSDIFLPPYSSSNSTDDETAYGCRDYDFDGDYKNKIAVLFRGVCEFEIKVQNALNAKASAVIVINNNPEGVIPISLGGFRGLLSIYYI